MFSVNSGGGSLDPQLDDIDVELTLKKREFVWPVIPQLHRVHPNGDRLTESDCNAPVVSEPMVYGSQEIAQASILGLETQGAIFNLQVGT